jgi:hypothetical protein
MSSHVWSGSERRKLLVPVGTGTLSGTRSGLLSSILKISQNISGAVYFSITFLVIFKVCCEENLSPRFQLLIN